jgi:hypothetical protein
MIASLSISSRSSSWWRDELSEGVPLWLFHPGLDAIDHEHNGWRLSFALREDAKCGESADDGS